MNRPQDVPGDVPRRAAPPRRGRRRRILSPAAVKARERRRIAVGVTGILTAVIAGGYLYLQPHLGGTAAAGDPVGASSGRAAAPPSSAAASADASASASASPTSSASAPPRGPGVAHPGLWQPKPGLTWQYQLSGTVDTSINAQVYDIDGQTNSASVVATLHTAGRKVICYVDAGTYENFRPDASEFPKSVLGSSNGWPGEQWLDIRRVAILKPIMTARFAVCKQKGFDAVEADNVDGYSNDTGFPLTAQDQLTYNSMLAQLAHADGLAIGLKNDLDQIPQLIGSFQFSVDEQCAQYNECGQLAPFIEQHKAVFEVEYKLQTSQFCARTTALGLSSMLKDINLDAEPRTPCPAS